MRREEWKSLGTIIKNPNSNADVIDTMNVMDLKKSKI